MPPKGSKKQDSDTKTEGKNNESTSETTKPSDPDSKPPTTKSRKRAKPDDDEEGKLLKVRKRHPTSLVWTRSKENSLFVL